MEKLETRHKDPEMREGGISWGNASGSPIFTGDLSTNSYNAVSLNHMHYRTHYHRTMGEPGATAGWIIGGWSAIASGSAQLQDCRTGADSNGPDGALSARLWFMTLAESAPMQVGANFNSTGVTAFIFQLASNTSYVPGRWQLIHIVPKFV